MHYAGTKERLERERERERRVRGSRRSLPCFRDGNRRWFLAKFRRHDANRDIDFSPPPRGGALLFNVPKRFATLRNMQRRELRKERCQVEIKYSLYVRARADTENEVHQRNVPQFHGGRGLVRKKIVKLINRVG